MSEGRALVSGKFNTVVGLGEIDFIDPEGNVDVEHILEQAAIVIDL